MLFFIGFGFLVIVLVVVVTALAQPPTRWVEKYMERNPAKFPQKKEAPPPDKPV